MTHSTQAERAVLYASISSKDAYIDVAEITRAEAFFSEDYAKMFSAIADLHDQGLTCDPMAVDTALRKSGVDPDMAVWDLIADPELALVNHKSSASLIEEHFIRRSIHNGLKEAMLNAVDLSVDVFDIQEQAERAVFEARRHARISGVKDMSVSVAEVLERLRRSEEVAKTGDVIGVTSGNKDIDRLMLGWQPTDLIILAARPSVGKSALGMDYAFSAGVPSLVFSLEMSARQIVERKVLPDANVSSYSARIGRLKQDDWSRIDKVAQSVSGLPVFIDDRPGIAIAEVKSVARRMKMKHDIGLIVVDYIQLVTGSNLSKSSNREQEISQISRGLKHIAKELEIPVIALSQLNRIRHDERPTLVNLRESGAIEQDADVVQFLWREPDINGERNPVVNYAFDKNRNGSLGGGQLVYKPDSAKLVSYYEEDAKNRYNA